MHSKLLILLMFSIVVITITTQARERPNVDACFAKCFIKYKPEACGELSDDYSCICNDIDGVTGCVEDYTNRTTLQRQCFRKLGRFCGDRQLFTPQPESSIWSRIFDYYNF